MYFNNLMHDIKLFEWVDEAPDKIDEGWTFEYFQNTKYSFTALIYKFNASTYIVHGAPI